MVGVLRATLVWTVASLVTGTQTPIPRPAPFPGSTPPVTAAKPPAPTPTPPATAGAPTAATAPPLDPRLAGIPIYPGAELLASYDAGRGQRAFVLGTNVAYADIVAYYKTQFRTSGRELFRAPAMQQFDLGRFQEDAMAYPPSVVVKDYTWMESPGYLHIAGTTEKRFKTLIQIVPPPR